MKAYKRLTDDDVQFFLKHGYVVIKQAFSREKAADWSKHIWVRLGMDPKDKKTWTRERIHMPFHKREPVSVFSPKAWEAMCDLLGGEERIDETKSTWGDSFIVNLGSADSDDATADSFDPHTLDNWHVDGDFFVHFLDSPEQALLVIPIFSEIRPRGGGTYVAPEGIAHVARYLAAHPEGVVPAGPPSKLAPSTSSYANPADDPEAYTHGDTANLCTEFHEMTGEVGDVVLLHPLMLHSASRNWLGEARIIINPPVALRKPFEFNRGHPDEFSLVERKTLLALGMERLDSKPTTERRRLTPKSSAVKDAMLAEEKQRLAALQSGKER